jgi:hypothetical protein
MAQQTAKEVLDMIEAVAGDEDIAGLVTRYRDLLVPPEGTSALLARLTERREQLRAWEGVANLLRLVRMQKVADQRHELETATSAVIQADGALALAEVVKQHPVVFSGSFLNSLHLLRKQARDAGDVASAELIENRLRHLQLLMLAQRQGLEITREKLRTIVHQVLEARSFGDVLERIEEYLITFSEAFDGILRVIAREGAKTGDAKLPEVAELRIAVLDGLRMVVEAVVRGQATTYDVDAAVEALTEATAADKFLQAVARFPFVLGEDFGRAMERELERARTEADETATRGLERRRGHLQAIARIVAALTAPAEPPPPQERS